MKRKYLKYIFKPRVVLTVFLERISFLIPDKLYLQMMFFLSTGKKLNLKHPVTFNEKLQWLKLYNRRPEYTIMVDKVLGKEYVAKKLGDQYIIPTLGIWDDPDDIDFDTLPDQFVMKCNHNSGLGMCICKDKSKLDFEKVRSELRRGLKQNYFLHGREWPYKHVPRRILAEKFMVDESGSELKDYKFFCFHGEPRLCQVVSDRWTEEKIDFYDMDWNRIIGLIGLIGLSYDETNSKMDIPCPYSFSNMKRMAKILAKDIPFSRIDFYEINQKPYFGEITFFPASGFGEFRPKEWNDRLGKLIKLPLFPNM